MTCCLLGLLPTVSCWTLLPEGRRTALQTGLRFNSWGHSRLSWHHWRKKQPQPLPRSLDCNAAPWDVLQGSIVDPRYWQQQSFLAGTLKKMLPQKKSLTALELEPADAKHISYMRPAEESGDRLDQYIVLGTVDNKLGEELIQQGRLNRAKTEFRTWVPGQKADSRLAAIDVALVSAGTIKRLGPFAVCQGLAEIRKVLWSKGRVIIVANEADEAALGVKLESFVEGEGGLESLKPGSTAAKFAQVLRDTGLRLEGALRNDCGLVLGICLKQAAAGQLAKAIDAVERTRAKKQKLQAATGAKRKKSSRRFG